MKIEFELGEPVTLTLRFAQGLEVASRYYERWPGDVTQYVFSTDQGSFYLPDGAGAVLNARLRSRGIAAGDTVTITKVRVTSPNAARAVTKFIPRKCADICER
jgi:hypothetical protein